MQIYRDVMELGNIQKAWIKSLREHPERQIIGVLGFKQHGSYKACCLGEYLLTVKGEACWDGDIFKDGNSDISLDTIWEEVGLRGKEGELLNNFTGGDGKFYHCLSGMNDEGYTWPEIADYVEANPENVFLKSF